MIEAVRSSKRQNAVLVVLERVHMFMKVLLSNGEDHIQTHGK
jgi:hypothetical protein